MDICSNCGTAFFFGSRKLDSSSYCSDSCASLHPLLVRAGEVPEKLWQRQVQHWRNGACPRCHKRGPVDVYEHHRVRSFVLTTQWHTRREVCCRPCGRRSQLGSALYSVALGWWGFPWGLLATPVQVARNLAAACQAAPGRATPALEKAVRLQIAQQAIDKASQPPPLPVR